MMPHKIKSGIIILEPDEPQNLSLYERREFEKLLKQIATRLIENKKRELVHPE